MNKILEYVLNKRHYLMNRFFSTRSRTSKQYIKDILGADYMGELSRLSELTRFTELTRFLLLFPIISTLRLHGKRVVPLRRDPG